MNHVKLAVWCGTLLAGGTLAGAQDAVGVFTSPPVHVYGQFTTPIGISPAQMTKAYGFSEIANQGAGQIIALIDAFDDPNVESDLGVFTSQFSLPACTTANSCFQKIYASGTQPTGANNWDWKCHSICKTRGVPDVAYNANPATGVPVYDSYGYNGWVEVGGTSAGAPQWAALIAIADSVRALAGKSALSAASILPGIYSTAYEVDLHDITLGSNGSCGSLCNAKKEYDFITGEGSPKANNLISALASLP